MIGMTYPRVQAVTKSDSADLPFPCHALYVGVTGNVTIIDTAGNTVLFKNLLQGHIHHGIMAKRVMSTGTSATDIVALGPRG